MNSLGSMWRYAKKQPVALAGVLVALGGLAVSLFNSQESESIAERSGQFSKPDLQVRVGGLVLYPEQRYTAEVLIRVPDSAIDNPLLYGGVPLEVVNWGDRTLDGLEVSVQVPPAFAIDTSTLKRMHLENTPSDFVITLHRTMRSDVATDVLTFGHLNPGGRWLMQYPVNLGAQDPTQMLLKRAPAFALYVHLHASNYRYLRYAIIVRPARAASLTAFERALTAEVESLRRDFRDTTSWARYISAVGGDKRARVTGIFNDYVPDPDGTLKLTMPGGNPGTAMTLDVPLAEWRGLWRYRSHKQLPR